MKVWFETAGDHSAKLRIVGTFKTEKDAQKAVERVNGLMDILKEHNTISPGDYFNNEVLAYLTKNNFSISPEAVTSCELHYPIERHGNSIEVETDELEIQIFLESFIICGGKLEIYSRHDY